MKFKFNIKERWQRFKVWREQPSQMSPLSDESHECECCHTSFQGNYCGHLFHSILFGNGICGGEVLK